MLALLLMAGLGFAATALIDHMDSHPAEPEHGEDAEDKPAVGEGSLLDEPEAAQTNLHNTTDDHGQDAFFDQPTDRGLHVQSVHDPVPAHEEHGAPHATVNLVHN